MRGSRISSIEEPDSQFGFRWELLPPFKEKFGDIADFESNEAREFSYGQLNSGRGRISCTTINACRELLQTLPLSQCGQPAKNARPAGITCFTFLEGF